MPISDNYGVVDKCSSCTNPDVPEHCVICMCRGFVAVCLNCSGKGQTTVPVAGASSGTMSSTCPACGGTGRFAVRKPETWDAEHAEPVEETKVEAESEEDAEFEAMTAGAKENSISSVELDEIASKLGAPPKVAIHEQSKIEDQLARSIYEDGKAESATEDEPKDDVELEAHTDPIRPKSVHWKVWGKFTPEQRIAAVEAAKIETPELASV